MKAVDPMDMPCSMGFKFRLPSGEFHTFILSFESSRQFLNATHKLKDRALVCFAFARCEEFPAAIISAEILVESGRKMRLDHIKKQ